MSTSESDPYAARKKITFEQAEGIEPLPSQLRPKEISAELRALLWERAYTHLKDHSYDGMDGREFVDPWEGIFYKLHVVREHRMVDDFENDFYELIKKTKNWFQHGNYHELLGWIQFVLRAGAPPKFAHGIQLALSAGRAAYRIVDNNTIVPIGSDSERKAIERAFADVAASEFHGARKHLQNAAQELTAGHNANSIRESIHAVESVVRALEPKGDFAKALARLEAKTNIHSALKAGFSSIYGFTSDEKGIRHPLLDKDAAQVDEADAMFMLGACAAFVSYLINKARTTGLLGR